MKKKTIKFGNLKTVALTTGAFPLAKLSSNSASLSCKRTQSVNTDAETLNAGQAPSALPAHRLPLLLQDDGLPGPLPQTQGLVVRRRHQVISVGADGQTPDLPMVTLKPKRSRSESGPLSGAAASEDRVTSRV